MWLGHQGKDRVEDGTQILKVSARARSLSQGAHCRTRNLSSSTGGSQVFYHNKGQGREERTCLYRILGLASGR